MLFLFCLNIHHNQNFLTKSDGEVDVEEEDRLQGQKAGRHAEKGRVKKKGGGQNYQNQKKGKEITINPIGGE
jgi:hypothetical protein